MTLALELIDQICQQLSPALENDLQTLSSCALVSHAFLWSSRRILFSEFCLSKEITLHNYVERSHTKNDILAVFFDILTRCPEYGHFVRKLYLDVDIFDDEDSGTIVMLKRLANLRSLTLV